MHPLHLESMLHFPNLLPLNLIKAVANKTKVPVCKSVASSPLVAWADSWLFNTLKPIFLLDFTFELTQLTSDQACSFTTHHKF
jgi:hypothetical protein